MRSSARRSEAGRRLRGFARVGLVVAGVVFWLNTALFPCCEVAAAVLGGHPDNGSRTASAAPPLHHSDATHSELLDHRLDSPCGHTLISGPPLVGKYEGPTPDRSPLGWFAADAPVATSLTAVSHSANLARAAPPAFAAPLPAHSAPADLTLRHSGTLDRCVVAPVDGISRTVASCSRRALATRSRP